MWDRGWGFRAFDACVSELEVLGIVKFAVGGQRDQGSVLFINLGHSGFLGSVLRGDERRPVSKSLGL